MATHRKLIYPFLPNPLVPAFGGGSLSSLNSALGETNIAAGDREECWYSNIGAIAAGQHVFSHSLHVPVSLVGIRRLGKITFSYSVD
jgi:hypothetical protein